MHDSTITLTGNVATDLRHVETDSGVHIVSFRLASTPRRYDKGHGWVDLETNYYTVTCWRFLAQNVAASLHKGDPVVVTGTPRIRQWEKDGKNGFSVDIDARVIGHDLGRGVTAFTKVTRTRPVSAEEDEALRLSAGQEGAEDPAPETPAGVDPRTGEIPANAASRNGSDHGNGASRNGSDSSGRSRRPEGAAA